MTKRKKCYVLNCPDQHSKRHRLPHPESNPSLFDIWVMNIRHPLFKNKTRRQIYEYYTICDRHFENKFKVPGSRRGLLFEAIPTLFLSDLDGADHFERVDLRYPSPTEDLRLKIEYENQSDMVIEPNALDSYEEQDLSRESSEISTSDSTIGKSKCVIAQESNIQNENVPGHFNKNLPLFSCDEISSHNTREKRIWVTYKAGVYDITDFIEGHPGGDQILMAAGSSVEPFWMLYGVHENPHVYAILENYRIGNLIKEEITNLTADMSDPYSIDPKRHVALKPASIKPYNAELPPELLVESFITPNELFYVRNHLPVPDVDPNTYELEIEIEGKNNVVFTLDQLKRLPKKTITATIMCAGNRRSEMTKVKPVKGLNWGAAAIGTATWTGVPIRDILLLAGVNEDEVDKPKHIQFEGLDCDITGKMYGASIPIWKALERRGDVILAYEMNGVSIPRDHGFPIRVIVPGVVGARNVKWLGKIIVSDKESDSHWQQNDYKGFSPSTDWDTVDFSKSPAIQELPVISAICQPINGSTVKVKDDMITVKGYAWSGGGQKIVRVDVTANCGRTWHVADFDHQDTALPPVHWAWTLWSVKIPVDKRTKNVEIWAKAVDSSYNTQPEGFENIWNLRGVLSNAYHKVKVTLKH